MAEEKNETMEGKQETLNAPSLEKELQEIKREFYRILEFFIPPKEVVEEVRKNLYTIPLSVLRIMRTLIDYEIKLLEERIKETESKPKSKRITVE